MAGTETISTALNQVEALLKHGENDVANFKRQMDSIHANYKFIVYANATHAFTNPDATAIGKKFNMPIEYNEKADMDSWNDMKMFFNMVLKK